MYIGELAKRAEVSERLVRYYEEIGLIPKPIRKGRYRIYDEDYIELIMQIREIKKSDLKSSSLVHKENFTRHNFSYEYLECSFNSYPKSLIYIVEENKNIIAYIIWTQKSGFRKEVVLELEQIAVLKNKQANNVGTELIVSSLKLVKVVLLKTQSRIKHIIVSTRDDNYAKKLYKKVLNVKVETVIKDLYSADEVIMIAKNIDNC